MKELHQNKSPEMNKFPEMAVPRRPTLVMKEQHWNESSMPFQVVLLADVLLWQMKNLEFVSAAAVLEVLVQHKLTIVLRVVCLLLVAFLHFLFLLKIL
jgi:hypothetical protein